MKTANDEGKSDISEREDFKIGGRVIARIFENPMDETAEPGNRKRFLMRENDAPSVAEIVQVLKQARGWCPQPGEDNTRQRINALVNLLEEK